MTQLITEIYPGILTFSIDLPQSPLREVHAYLLMGADRPLVIDTGYNRPECLEQMTQALNHLGLGLGDVDLLLTHLHADHTGLASQFHEAGATIYAGAVDGQLMNQMATGEYWDLLDSLRASYGIDQAELSITDNPGYQFRLSAPVPFQVLEIGSHLKWADFDFEILDLIGHTPGHIGLYDAQKRLLISADTVLDPITPNITYWGAGYPNILGTYLETLNRIKSLELDLLLTGHRKLITNPKERIEQLQAHHQERLQEILAVLTEEDWQTVRTVSSRISWRIKADGWDHFPRGQKWFASGETMAHLDYLVHTKQVSRLERAGVLYFQKSVGQD